MKVLQPLLTALAVLFVLGLTTQAQEEQDRPTGLALLPPGVLEKLNLTAEQWEKIAKLHKELREKVEPVKKTMEGAVEKARQKAHEAQEVFHKEVSHLHQAFREELAQVLTEEQRHRLGELVSKQKGGPAFDLPKILGQLDLNAEQKGKVEKVLEEFSKKHEAAKKKLDEAVEQAKQNQDREKVQELLQAHHKEMVKVHEELFGKVRSVLTEEQKRRFADVQHGRLGASHAGGGHLLPPQAQERLGLTPDQRAKVAKLQKEMEKETEAKLREILNEEQNRKLDELKGGGAVERPKSRK